MQHEDMSLKAIGRRIELERIRVSLKSNDVCAALDIHPSTYRNYETGKRDMPASKMALLGKLGFNIPYILTGDESLSLSLSGDQPVRVATQSKERLIKDYHDDAQSNALLSAMNQSENTLQRAGAVAGIDYNYVDLAKIGVQLLHYGTAINDES